MKKPSILKPDLNPYFKKLPMPYSVLFQEQYNKAMTREELTALCHKWLNLRETATSSRACYIYTVVSHTLYAILTDKSYESKIYVS